jgi:low temperature requirement protein LtrA
MFEQQIHAPHGQRVTFVELFFDLVFVFALTEITGFLFHHLDGEGVVRTALIFWLIWWAWTQWTWALNPADTEHTIVRVGTLLATAIAFLMAVSVADAFEEDGGLWFAVPYIAIRVLGLALYARVAVERDGQFDAVRGFALLSSLGLIAVLLGAFLDPDVRVSVWIAAVALDVFAAAIAGRFESWHLHTEHFAERHALFVIIALGESLIVSASVVVEAERTTELVIVGISAVAVTCLLWWTYYGWFKDAIEHRMTELRGAQQSTYARDAYSFLHLPLIGGVVGVAIGFEAMLEHPGDPVADEVLLALGIGLALFLGASVAIWARAYERLLWVRLAAPAALAVVLLAAADLKAGWILIFVAMGLAVVVATEAVRPPAEARETPPLQAEIT